MFTLFDAIPGISAEHLVSAKYVQYLVLSNDLILCNFVFIPK